MTDEQKRDAELVRQILSGDESAFEVLYALYKHRLYRYNANDENRGAAEEWAAYWRSVVIDLADYLREVQCESQEAAHNLYDLQEEYQKNNVRIDDLAHDIAVKEAELEQLQGN